MSGDFNIDWSKESTIKEKFDTLMSLHSFNQVIDSPLRCFKGSKTIIDLIFTNRQNLIQKRDFRKFDECEFFECAKYINFHSIVSCHCAHQAAELLKKKYVIS